MLLLVLPRTKWWLRGGIGWLPILWLLILLLSIWRLRGGMGGGRISAGWGRAGRELVY